MMRTAKVFKSGNSQAVRLPKEFHIDAKEVEIIKENGNLRQRKGVSCDQIYAGHRHLHKSIEGSKGIGPSLSANGTW